MWYKYPMVLKTHSQSRWQNRRMQYSALLTNTSRIHLQMEKFLTEHLLNINRRLQTPQRIRKIPLQPDRMKERKKEELGRDQHAWQEAEDEEVPALRKLLTVGKSGTFEDWRNAVNAMWKAGQSRDWCMVWGHSPAPQPESCVSLYGGGLGAGKWDLECKSREGQLLGVKRQPAGTGVRSTTAGEVCGRCLKHHRAKASLLSGMQGLEPPLQTPFHLLGFCLCRHWKGHSPEQTHPPSSKASTHVDSGSGS